MTRQRLHELFDMYTYKIGMYGARSLSDAYMKASGIKKNIWDQIERGYAAKNGKYLSVIGVNTFMFTAGFIFKSDKGWEFYAITPSEEGSMVLGINELAECKRQGIILKEWTRNE